MVTMMNEGTTTSYTEEITQSTKKEVLQWRDMVEKRRKAATVMLVRVCEINEITDREVADVRVGDELFLRDAKIAGIQLSLADTYDTKDESERESTVIPVTFGGKFRARPHFIPTHKFHSVQELLDVYPFISDLIFAQEPFVVEGVKVAAWEILQVLNTVHDTPSASHLLEVEIVTRKRSVLLPASLQVTFLQWNDNWSLQEAVIMKKRKPRIYSLSELCEYWNTDLQPVTIEMCNITTNGTDEQTSSPQHGKSAPLSKFVSRFIPKDKPKIVESPTDVQDDEENFWMIPEEWRSKPLVLDPILSAHVANATTTKEFSLPGEMKMKVVQLSTQESREKSRPTSLASISDLTSEDPFQPPEHVAAETATPLHQLNIMSLLSNKGRNNAIIAVVTSGINMSSRQTGTMAFGTWLAFHRTRRVRKLLFKSFDSQHLLVSAHYAGSFTRLPIIFDCAGEVPVGDDNVYITRCTAYPVEKALDACREDQYVWFQTSSTLTINDNEVKVVHCFVSDSVNGQQHSVSYPLDLRGRFERVDNSSTELSTQDLFRKNLPVCVRVEKPDASIGFDPLSLKQSLLVTKIVSEISVVVEVLRKTEDGVKSTGTIIELPAKRDSVLLREVPLKSEDPIRGIDPFPRRKNFKGLQKLPCVEMLAEIHVADLQDASRCLSSSSILSPTEKTSPDLPTPPLLPRYAVVQKNEKGNFTPLPDAEEVQPDSPPNNNVNNDQSSVTEDKNDVTVKSSPKNGKAPIDDDEDYEPAKEFLSTFSCKLKIRTASILKNTFKPKPAVVKRQPNYTAMNGSVRSRARNATSRASSSNQTETIQEETIGDVITDVVANIREEQKTLHSQSSNDVTERREDGCDKVGETFSNTEKRKSYDSTSKSDSEAEDYEDVEASEGEEYEDVVDVLQPPPIPAKPLHLQLN